MFGWLVLASIQLSCQSMLPIVVKRIAQKLEVHVQPLLLSILSLLQMGAMHGGICSHTLLVCYDFDWEKGCKVAHIEVLASLLVKLLK